MHLNQQDLIAYGIGAVPGVAMGRALMIYPPADLDAIPDRSCNETTAEIEHFLAAITATKNEIKSIGERITDSLSTEDRALFEVYLRILDSESLMTETIQIIQAGQWAQGAIKRVIKAHIKKFELMHDSYLKERANDLKDLGQRVLAHLQAQQPQTPSYPDNTILIGEEITATDLAQIPPGKVIGVISARGSHNSHVAILARAMNIPTVMGVNFPPALIDGAELIVDGIYGQVFINPSAKIRQEYIEIATQQSQVNAELESLRHLPSETLDGFPVPLLINTGLPSDTPISLSTETDGIGLYRTEVPFMIRDSFPSEEEQRILYRQLLKSLAPRPVIMRTLDIGGDKSLSYFPIHEDNPFLGWRGIRVTLDHPEVFLVQVRAMLKASSSLDNLRIMLPMISCVSEVDEALRLLNKAYQEVTHEDKAIKLPPVGVMIDVPSAVYMSEIIAQKVDF